MMIKNFSATKAAMLIFVITACAGFLLNKITSELFGGMVLTVLGFYFGGKNQAVTQPQPTQTFQG